MSGSGSITLVYFGSVTTISVENTSPIGQLSKIYKVCASYIDLSGCNPFGEMIPFSPRGILIRMMQWVVFTLFSSTYLPANFRIEKLQSLHIYMDLGALEEMANIFELSEMPTN